VSGKLRYAGRVARLMAANWRDAIAAGSWAGRQALRGGLLDGLGWFLIVGTPIVFILQGVGLFSGPKASSSDVIWGVGFVLGGILLVALNRRIPRRDFGLRHFVLSERDEYRRYVPVCSCGWIGQPHDTVEGLLLEGRAHKKARSSLES
jgi:hypothetical protein